MTYMSIKVIKKAWQPIMYANRMMESEGESEYMVSSNRLISRKKTEEFFLWYS